MPRAGSLSIVLAYRPVTSVAVAGLIALSQVVPQGSSQSARAASTGPSNARSRERSHLSSLGWPYPAFAVRLSCEP